MIANLARGVIAALLCTAVLGFAYPALMVGIGKGFFGHEASGSLVRRDGRVVGSTLAAEDFRSAGAFHPRPSATGYDAAGTSFSNLGPTSAELLKLVRQRTYAYVAENAPYFAGLTARQVPVDAVTASGSGIDPHISPQNARIQAHRVAAVRGIALARVQELIRRAEDARVAGIFGEPGVNVVELNLALEEETR